MTGHPDPEVLAEFREGLLGWRRARRIRTHLAGCARCGAVSREIAEVSSLLASAPAPRMPDQLASRLEAALAAESTARAAQAHGQKTAADPAARRRPAALRVPALRAAAIAAAVVVIAGGGYGLARVLSGPGGAGASGGVLVPSTNQPAGSARLSTNQPLEPGATHGAKSAAGAGMPAGTVPVIHSGTGYQPGRLVAQVERVLRQTPAYGSLPGDLGPLQRNRGLSGCVLLITRGVRPRLVDEARYRGQPATVIVTAGTGGRPGQIWVAGSACSASRPDVIAHAQLTGTGLNGTG